MSAKAILTPRPNSFKFIDRIIDLDIPTKIGRAFKNEKSDNSNGYFDCKVNQCPQNVLHKIFFRFYLKLMRFCCVRIVNSF